MPTPSCLIELKNKLPRNAWAQVTYALRQEPVIWQALQNPDFRGLALAKLGSHPAMWHPLNLALLALKTELQPAALRTAPLAEIDPAMHQLARQTYAAHTVAAPPQMTLAAAGLLALALQEHRHLNRTWENIPHTAHWLTPYACLFSLLAQPAQLLRNLPPELTIHAILANPLTAENQIHLLTAILTAQPTRQRLAMLRELARHRPDLCPPIARKLWHSTTEDAPPRNHQPPQLSELAPQLEQLRRLAATLTTNLSHAEAQFTAGYRQKGHESVQLAWQTSQQLQNNLAYQAIQSTARLGHLKQAQADWAHTQSIRPFSPQNTAALALIWLEQGQFNEAQTLLHHIKDQSAPVVQLARVSILLQKGSLQGTEQSALAQTLIEISNHVSNLSTSQQYLLAQQLLKLKQPNEALRVLETARQTQPHHLEIIRLTAQAHAAVGTYPQAIQAMHLAAALNPDQVEIQREYAEIHELAGLWPAAIAAREQIIKTQQEPTPADYHALAASVLQLNQYTRAEKACEKALNLNPDDGLAQALLGEARAGLGHPDKARVHFQAALQQAGDQARPWLALARFYQQDGNPAEARATLRKAAHAVPDWAEIHLALGRDYLQAEAHVQALDCLQRAARLADSETTLEAFHLHSLIALPLAKTYFELGHAEEALETIQTAFPLPENQVEMLHLQAQILIFLQRAEQAIPLLAKALMATPADTTINLAYARAQLEARHAPEKAISALLALLQRDPDNPEALAWLAEAFKAQGDAANALTVYRQALATRLSADHHWHTRLSIGLAQSALALDQPETALAALEGNWHTSPQNQQIILQTLATAYQKAQLYDQALQTARTARDMDPVSLDNLRWFANLAEAVQAYDDAANALNCAIELAPYRAGLRLQLGALHQKVGDLTEAYRIICTIVEIDQTTGPELQTAAKYLIALDHPEDALVCLRAAADRCLNSAEKQPCTAIISALLDTYLKLERPADALSALDLFLAQLPQTDPHLVGKRAILLSHQLGRDDEAHATLAQALANDPRSNPLHLAASRIHYAAGNLADAFEHAQQAADNVNENDTTDIAAQTLAWAADMAAACLATKMSREICQHPLQTPNRPYLCLSAELALAAGREIEAANAVTMALQLGSAHPRVLALQARLIARNGDRQNASETLQNALIAWGEAQDPEISSPAGMLALAEAALELQEWDTAIYLLREAARLFPQEPRVHLRLVRGLVQRAEFQRLCETLRVIRHAPGLSTVANFTYQQFERAILAAAQTSDGLKLDAQPVAITHWRVRGQAIFQPSGEHARAFSEIPHTPQSRAALLAALRYSREKKRNQQFALENLAASSHQLMRQSGMPGSLRIEIALALGQHKPQIAIDAAQSALAISIHQKSAIQPIFYAVLASVHAQTGDLAAAGLALEQALALWQNESRWHLWAAEIQQARDEPDREVVLHHLTEAVRLEPKYGLHQLRLGQAHMTFDNPRAAIPALEEATQLLSRQARPWLTLAQAYQAIGDTAQICQSAQQAASLDPLNLEPHRMLAQAAMDMNDPAQALQYCQQGLAIAADPQISLIKALALAQTQQPEAARQVFAQAIAKIPKSIALGLEYVQFTRRAAGKPAAVEALHTLADEHPESPTVLAALAEALVDNNQLEPAILAAQKALQCGQGVLSAAQEADLQKTLGYLLHRNGQLDQAIHYLSKAIRHNPPAVESYLALGRVYQDRRQYSAAVEAFQQAIALDSGNAQAYYLAGQTLKEIKDYEAAEAMLQTAAQIAPDDLAIRRQLGGLVALNLVHNHKEDAEFYVK